MKLEDTFELGYILGPHGLKGEVKLVLDTDDPEHYRATKILYLPAKAGLVPFTVEAMNLRGSQAIIKLSGINTVEMAQELKGRTVHLPTEALPELEDDQFYFHDLEGFTILDADTGAELGKIQEVLEMPQQDMLVVIANGREALIPLADDFLIEVRKEESQLIMRLPEGLLDVYLGSEQ